MKFDKIACADNPGLPDWAFDELEKLTSKAIIRIKAFPQSNDEIIRNIGDADCALVSWNTIIDNKVIESCPQLKYIGMCCSLIDEQSANVDIATARKHGIVVKGVRDYGDEGVIEYIFSELIRLLKGLGKHQWKNDQLELGGQKIGIIGMGTTGKMLAEAALFFKMEVYYYSRTRNLELEAHNCTWLPLNELLTEVDILSIHLPKNTSLLNENHFKLFGKGKILINTTLGLSFEEELFIKWLTQKGNYAIMDRTGAGAFASEFIKHENIILTDKTSGFTHEAKNRLAQKVIENISDYFNAKI